MADILDFDGGREDWPRPGDPYRAFGPPAQVSPPAVTFFFRDGGGVSIPYGRLGLCEYRPAAGERGDVIILRIDVATATLIITLEGRLLYPLWEQLMYHRVVWVRERPDEWRLDATAVVDSITPTREPCPRPGAFRPF